MQKSEISVIGCIPLWAQSTPPADQEDVKIEACPCCGKEMWVSLHKRELRETGKYITVCFYCYAQAIQKKGYKLSDIQIVDIKDQRT